MIDYVASTGFLPHSRAERRVKGLREYEKPTECRVFQANPDGTVGTLIRIEPPIDYDNYCQLRFNNNGRGKK